MKTTLLSSIAAFALFLGLSDQASAQTTVRYNNGTSFSRSSSTSWGYGPNGYYSNTQNSGNRSQWGNVGINAVTPNGVFNGNFSNGRSTSWNNTTGYYGGPNGGGVYSARQGVRTNWNNSNWGMSTPNGNFGNSSNNLNQRTWNNGFSRTYP